MFVDRSIVPTFTAYLSASLPFISSRFPPEKARIGRGWGAFLTFFFSSKLSWGGGGELWEKCKKRGEMEIKCKNVPYFQKYWPIYNLGVGVLGGAEIFGVLKGN